MAREETIETGGAGGGAGAKKGAEDYKNSYAVKALTDMGNLKLLAKLPVFDAKVEANKKGVVFEMDELLSLGYTGDTTGAPMQMFDRIFDTLEIPYIAGTIARGGIKKVKVIRYGDEFDPSKYSTTRAGKPSYATEIVDEKRVYKLVDGEKVQDGIIDHENSPEGLVACMEEWLGDIAEDETFTEDMIVKLGLDRKMRELGFLIEE